MAKTISNAQLDRLHVAACVVAELGLSETQPVKKAALFFCAESLLNFVATPRAPATAVTQAGPPAAPVLTITEVDGPTPPIRAHAHAAAVKATATRKANKAKAAATAKPGDAAGSAPAGSDALAFAK